MAASLVFKSGVLPEQISKLLLLKDPQVLLHSTRRCSLAIPGPVHEQIGSCGFTSACSQFLCIYTSYSYDSHIYVLSSYTSVVSLTYVLTYIRPHICSLCSSVCLLGDILNCQMMTSCLGSHADISGQYWVMVNSAI